MPRQGLWGSFGHAWDGVLHAVLAERNMRIHLVSGVLVGLVGMGMPVGLAEKAALLFCVVLVFFAEILNTGLEAIVDLLSPGQSERARVAKDAAAAGVLVLASGTVLLLVAVIADRTDYLFAHAGEIGRRMAAGFPLGGCVAGLVAPGKRPLLVDAALLLAALGLFGYSAVGSYSRLFEVFTLALLGVAAAAMVRRRREAA